LFSLGIFLKITEVAQDKWLLFSTVQVMYYFLAENRLGHILGVFQKLVWSPCLHSTGDKMITQCATILDGCKVSGGGCGSGEE
jgi:hypothetical protein